MKKLKVISIAILFFLPAFVVAQDPGDNIFAGIQIHTIKVYFTQPNYWDSLTTYYEQGDEQTMMVSAIVDTAGYDSIGIRFKGNSSFSHPNDKKSFKISFDEYLDDQRWDGLKSFHLNNCWGDPTFMREKIFLDFCRDAGITAPRANYVRLYINDQFWGLYSLVEHVDKTFLKTRFGNKNGDLFKAVDAFDRNGTAIISDFKWYGTEDSLYQLRYELKTDESTTAWTTLVPFLDTLNNQSNTSEVFQKKINLDQYYKALTADILFANLDSYINSGRNFYFYFLPTTNKMEWIIWDTGLSFGVYNVGVSKLETMSVTYVVDENDRPLVGKIYNTSSLKNDYLHTLNSLFTSYFPASKLFLHIDSVANAIRSSVNEDPRKMYTPLQFETNIVSDIEAEGGGGTRKPGLKSFINSRNASVQSQLTSLGLSDVEELSEIPLSFSLSQNYPNPFNPTTIIEYTIPTPPSAPPLSKGRDMGGVVTLKVYDVLGKEVATLVNEYKRPGTHSVLFDASRLSSGIYFYQIKTGSFSQTKRMMLIK